MLRRLGVSLLAAVALGAGSACLYGLAEILVRGLSLGRYLPVMCIFYLPSGAAGGLLAWMALLAFALFSHGRDLLKRRLLSVVVAAVVVTPWAAIAVLELTSRFLPHQIAFETVSLGVLGYFVTTGAALVAAHLVGPRLALASASLFGAALVVSAVVPLLATTGVLRQSNPSASKPSGVQPNVVIVLIDSLRADHLSCYGYARSTSPAIDAIAATGVRFTAAYSQGPWTQPSVAALFTSRLVSQLWGGDGFRDLPHDVPTWAEHYRDAGFQTAALVSNPVVRHFGFERGFDFFYFGMLDFNSLHLHRYWEWLDLTATPWYSTRSDHVTARVAEWFEEEADPERPFFLYVHYMDPHEPYTSRREYSDLFRTPGVEPVELLPYPKPGFLPFDSLPDDQIVEKERLGRIDAYDAAIRQNDDAVRSLVDMLRSRDLWEETLFVVLSDHGEEFGDHGGWGHGQSLFNEIVRVPLIIRFPGDQWAGEVVDSNLMLVDVLPTLAQLSSVAPLDDRHGRSFLPELASEQSSQWREREVVSELFSEAGAQRVVIKGEWKGLFASTIGTERTWLFDLSEDWGERHDLAEKCDPFSTAATDERSTTEACSTSLALKGLGSALLGELSEFGLQADPTLRQGVRRQLEALGYLD